MAESRTPEHGAIDVRQALQQLDARIRTLEDAEGAVEEAFDPGNLLTENGDLLLDEDGDRLSTELGNARGEWDAVAIALLGAPDYGHLLKEDAAALLTDPDGDYLTLGPGTYMDQLERRLVAGGL